MNNMIINMLIKIDIENEIFQKIKQLIDEGKYQDLYQFVTIAINNQIHEERAKKDSDLPLSTLQDIKLSGKEAARFFSETKSELDQAINPDWRKLLEKTIPQESEIEPQYNDLIWSFYNRFFPVKIVIYQLATMIAENGSWIELTELQLNSYKLASRISKSLREYEEQYDLGRNQKLSTGLPTPGTELVGIKRLKERRKMEDKIESGRKRFMEQFVGKKIPQENYDEFKGACFDMGLMAVKFLGNTTLVNLTQTGKEFALLENPILDAQRNDISFSKIETDFILKKIIPRFKLENIIVIRILHELRNEKLSSEQINQIFREEKMKFLKVKEMSIEKIEEHTEDKIIVSERVATMGRLSELGLVKWEIDRKGFSSYSLKNS
jgi:hypothetical protein